MNTLSFSICKLSGLCDISILDEKDNSFCNDDGIFFDKVLSIGVDDNVIGNIEGSTELLIFELSLYLFNSVVFFTILKLIVFELERFERISLL